MRVTSKFLIKFSNKVLNYLNSFKVYNIKLILVQKDKFINTITKDRITTRNVKECGFSISFMSDKTSHMISFNNVISINDVKRRLNSLLELYNIKHKNNYVSKSFFSKNDFCENSNELHNFQYSKYQSVIDKFISSCKHPTDAKIKLLSEKKSTTIISPENKNAFKEEFNYKIDLMVNSTISGISRFNYFSKGCSESSNIIDKLDIYNQMVILYESLIKMKTLDNFNDECDVVFACGIGGLLFHESCGHSLESREIIRENSSFNDKSDFYNKYVNYTDNPKLHGEFGSFNIDDEGLPSKVTSLIKNGVIKSYLSDEKGKYYLGSVPGSCRRESYYSRFSSRMSNTYIENGKDSFDKIIKSVKSGFYVKNIVGGVVDTISGNFAFNCIETYKIINGKIDNSVCYDNLTVIGNASEALLNITSLGNDLNFASGVCGSESGFIYTTVGQPTTKISNLQVVS